MAELLSCVADRVLERRARGLVERLVPHLPLRGALLDVGCGTGHNAEALRRRTGLRVVEADVTDMKTRGEPPLLFDGKALPLPSGSFDAALLAFVVHYADEPRALLAEVARVARSVLLLQSTHEGGLSLGALRLRELLQGRLPHGVARALGYAGGEPRALLPRRFYGRLELDALVASAGLRVTGRDEGERSPLALRRELLALEAAL